MQNVNRISGFTLIDENNVEQNIELFSPHINNNGGYYQLYDAIKDYLILNHGFTLSQFKEMDPEISCHKNGEPTVGYFIEQSHIKLVSIDGFLDWEGTIGFELEFLTKNCQ